MAPWNFPSCPYPSSNWNRPTNGPKSQQGGILGPKPQQAAFNVNTTSPTDIEMLSTHSILLSQTRHGTWTPEPPLT
jgi:hypothetical protein